MSDYAVIGKLKLEEIEGAKTLQRGIYGGLPFLVGKEVTEKDLVVIFLPDGRISEEYAKANDCIDRGRDENGKKLGGFFGKNRKVRTVTLFGNTSVGYVASLDTLAFAGDVSKLREGDVVDTFNGVPIAEKFVPTLTAQVATGETGSFLHHSDTEQFYKRLRDIPVGAYLIITQKLHGASARFISLPTPKKWWERLLFITRYETVAGTRNTIVKGSYNLFNTYWPWLYWRERVHPKPYESIYGELVGWQHDKPIQKAGKVEFTYGVPKGKCELYVYNIKQGNVNLPWWKVKERAQEMGLKTVREVLAPFIFDGDYEWLEKLVYSITPDPDMLGCPVSEGVVIRVEHKGQVYFLKSKNPAFLVLEDESKNKGETNLEEEL